MERNDSRFVTWGAILAMAGGAAFVLKVAYIFVLDGGGNAVIAGLYVAGFGLPLFAAAGLAARFASRIAPRIGVYFLMLFLHLFFITSISDGIRAAINAAADVPGYVANESPLALLGMIWLLIGYRIWSRLDRRPVEAPSEGRNLPASV